jgi:hypothetical protein
MRRTKKPAKPAAPKEKAETDYGVKMKKKLAARQRTMHIKHKV